jgi:hypothetical protein
LVLEEAEEGGCVGGVGDRVWVVVVLVLVGGGVLLLLGGGGAGLGDDGVEVRGEG